MTGLPLSPLSLPLFLFIKYLFRARSPSNLERALDKHATHRALDTTYNPTLLARTASISADISHLLEVPEPAWRTHPLHKTLTANPPRPLTAYLGRINELAAASDPTALLAHSYVRYLGDLSGGQIIRHSLAKAYGLDETLCLGLEFYRFKELTTQEWAGHGEMRRIKDWFKEGMNTAGNRDRLIKGARSLHGLFFYQLFCPLMPLPYLPILLFRGSFCAPTPSLLILLFPN